MDKFWDESAKRTEQLDAAHEHVWVPSYFSRALEECSVPGCNLGRYSRSWLERLRPSHSAAVQQ